ncbi:hypothetical protein AMS68_007731 [Peltaster fructicola]|uniref:Uncharacterized protein n=1 Tax=Peltaster fructicola TaxID=286661 RepID=A0A6H0Y5C7_9PEZI|nr:hypothetical protein AMS68_007731 [Peltaster fructicola]
MSHINSSYSKDGFADIDTARDTFATQFNLDQPEQAMSSYQKIMHQHTKQQFELAAASSRRRSSASAEGSTLSASVSPTT